MDLNARMTNEEFLFESFREPLIYLIMPVNVSFVILILATAKKIVYRARYGRMDVFRIIVREAIACRNELLLEGPFCIVISFSVVMLWGNAVVFLLFGFEFMRDPRLNAAFYIKYFELPITALCIALFARWAGNKVLIGSNNYLLYFMYSLFVFLYTTSLTLLHYEEIRSIAFTGMSAVQKCCVGAELLTLISCEITSAVVILYFAMSRKSTAHGEGGGALLLIRLKPAFKRDLTNEFLPQRVVYDFFTSYTRIL